jgi:dTDP-4-amino-4,6-dideoxygalactose transaminase
MGSGASVAHSFEDEPMSTDVRSIPAFDYRRELARYRAEVDDAVRRVLDSGILILGPEVAAFEREMARWLDVREAVGVNSGTDALAVALRALGIGQGDEVITVAAAGTPPISAIRQVGAVPRFVDVEPHSVLMDVPMLDRVRTPRTRCVIPIHLYGRMVPMEPVLSFAAAHGLRVVEDCAQAHGATWRGRAAGTFGDVGCFSFYPTKNLGAFGDGGIAVTNDADLAARMRAIRMYGFRGDRHAHVEGVNTRLDELQAAILRVKLAHLDRAVADRRELAARYRAGLAGAALELPPEDDEAIHAYHLFVVQTDARDRVTAELGRAGVGYGIHYPEPVHRMEAYVPLATPPLPVTERAARRVLSLPLYPGLTAAEIDRVVAAVGETTGRR